MLPDFASTAHMIQGQTLDAVFADALEHANRTTEDGMIAAYVAMSRVRSLHTICVLQQFSIERG